LHELATGAQHKNKIFNTNMVGTKQSLSI